MPLQERFPVRRLILPLPDGLRRPCVAIEEIVAEHGGAIQVPLHPGATGL